MSCPVWWETRDVWFTPHGRARALQGGATVEEIADSVLGCTMCGACEPVCPEEIDVMAMVRHLRTELHEKTLNPLTRNPVFPATDPIQSSSTHTGGRLLLAGPHLEAHPQLLSSVVECLGGPDAVRIADDDGRDLAWAYESGAPLDEARLDQFLDTLNGARDVVLFEGILHPLLRERASGVKVRGFAETLLDDETMATVIGPRDFFVIDARSFHANHARLVGLFHALRTRCGCTLNLDLQRVAIPTGADSLQARDTDLESCAVAVDWMLEGREMDRIVVESPADLAVLASRTDIPVVHLATLVAEGLRR